MGLFLKSTNGAQRFHLDLPGTARLQLPPQLNPMTSPSYEKVPMWNILPSYQLYESTFSKNVNPRDEDLCVEPPTYDAALPRLATSENSDYFGNAGRALRWEDSILANTHRLKRLATLKKPLADCLHIDITLTRGPGAKGSKPDVYDPLRCEFLQGDSVHGYVVVRNTSTHAVPFDMFSVVLEGRVCVNGDVAEGKKPVVFYKFLNMFDYKALWTPAFFNTADTEVVDPVDGTLLLFPNEKYLEPGTAYKRFFTFTLPDTLLDCACETHEIPRHCRVLPSVGLDKDMFLQLLRRARDKLVRPGLASRAESPLPGEPKRTPADNLVRDFCFPDTSVCYCVEARLVGKRSSYTKSTSPGADEFIIVKEGSASLRVVPRSIEDSAEDDVAAQRYYETFLRDVKSIIERGLHLHQGEPLRRPSTSKQLYTLQTLLSRPSQRDRYEVFLPYKRKTLTQASKVVGVVSASVPRKEYVVRYVSPASFILFTDHDTTKISKVTVPLSLSFRSADAPGAKLPEIKGVTVDLVACTIRSKKYPIPIELSTDMELQNSLAPDDGLERYVVQPFKDYLLQIEKLIEKHGAAALDISQQTIMDIKSLANLLVKSVNLKFDHVSTKTQGGLSQWTESEKGYFTKDIAVTVDLQSLFAKDTRGYSDDLKIGALCLVPTFQSCIISRYYYLLLGIKLGNGEVLLVKVPAKIAM